MMFLCAVCGYVGATNRCLHEWLCDRCHRWFRLHLSLAVERRYLRYANRQRRV